MSEASLLEMVAKIVSAHVTNNEVDLVALPGIIVDVHRALASVGVAQLATPAPAVPIKKSVFPDYIICLEDGRQLKSLRRHLLTTYNMTVDEYREKWGLGDDYPTVAPNYAARRSELAKSMGLGKTRGKVA